MFPLVAINKISVEDLLNLDGTYYNFPFLVLIQ